MSEQENKQDALAALQATFTQRVEDARQLAKQTMLVGLGAMDRSVEEVSTLRNQLDEQIADLGDKGSALFNELVERGSKVQADAEANLKDGRDAFEQQVGERVDQLKQSVASLTEQMGVAESLESLAGTLDSVSKRFGRG